MSNYDEVKVRVFASRAAYESRDAQDEQRIAETIRDDVLPTFSTSYRSVNVKVVRGATGSPGYLVAYMLRSDTYTADVVKVELGEDFQVTGIVENYDDSDDDDGEIGPQDGTGPPEYGVDFVVATPESSIKSAVDAVNHIYTAATNAGLTAKKLIGAQATVAAYKYYLRSGLKGFVNIGHGNTNSIVLHDGVLHHTWFSGLANNPLRPAVVYFNSCQVFNAPLKAAIVKAGARTYIGGIVNLLIGPSEKVCMCFWDRSLPSPVARMNATLTACEKANYPTQGAHGITGDTGPFKQSVWYSSKPVIRTHNKTYSTKAYALLGNMGFNSWIPVLSSNTVGEMNTFSILCNALANGRKVDVFIRDGQIQQATLK